MEALETLAVALGFASLAGINLYLTVFITGLAIHFQWVDLSKYSELMILGEPAVLIAAGIFTVVEFCSDKIPWVDSAWDSVHTLIRPIGGGILALTALGPTDPAFAVIVAMLASGTSLMTHGLKSGTRLAINTSPEPVSNVTASVTEDLAVMGGLTMMYFSPWLFAGVAAVFVGLSIYMAPKLYRRMKAFTWLFSQKFSSVFKGKKSDTEINLPIDAQDEALLAEFCQASANQVNWSLPVIIGPNKRVSKLKPNTFGKIYSLNNEPGVLHFISKKRHVAIELMGMDFIHEPRFASEDVVIENFEEGRRLVMRLPIGSKAIALRVINELIRSRNTAEQQEFEAEETPTLVSAD